MKDPIRITSLTRLWRRFLRLICKNEWIIWLMGLPRSEAETTEPGLILVQIDGLSRTQLQAALQHGRMPFLKRLLKSESYTNHLMYSGLPASTPAVQGELIYGKTTAVPAFGFRNHETGKLDRMFESSVALRVEAQLSKGQEGLLKDGSSYCNIYGGGAAEQHFCATSFGWSEFFKTANPVRILLFLILNFWMFVRVFCLLLIELVLACGGFIRGVLKGRQFFQELLMIPARVVVVVLLRELITIGACSDAARGVPVIMLNYLGFDEQAHRRGPHSGFAHWSLRGIDHCIRRVWNAAHRGAGREYDVWIYSDHGQEQTEPYQIQHGQLIQERIAQIVDEHCQRVDPCEKSPKARLPSRASWLGLGWLVTILFGEQDHDMQDRSHNVQTVTSGDVGFVYLLSADAKDSAETIAEQLVTQAHVPMVVQKFGDCGAKVYTADGSYLLPEDSHKVLQPELYREEVAKDLIRLTDHPDAGDLILIGWSKGQSATSFVLQNGAHAGPGDEETEAFALIPNDIPIDEKGVGYLRPDQIRRAALELLGRSPTPEKAKAGAVIVRPARTLATNVLSADKVESDQSVSDISILTYNVHACVGMDGELSPRRIARVIAQSKADIICLQELDVNRHRSHFKDQALEIASHLSMDHLFHPAWHVEEEKFGNAILSLYPLRVICADGLHHHKQDRSRRSAIWAAIDLGERGEIQVINTHLSIFPRERLIQSQELLEKWIQPASELGPAILCGDFNALPRSKTHQTFCSRLLDVESFDNVKTRPTYFSPYPMARLDHIFVDEKLLAHSVHVIDSRLAKMASDHRPLLARLGLAGQLNCLKP